MARLAGKVALVTGGSEGIGRAIALLFAQEGASVVVTGRRKERLEQVVREIEQLGGQAAAVAGTVSDEAHVRAAVTQAVQAYEGLHVLVNNAAVGAFGMLLHETDDATWDEQLAVNVTGVFRMTRAALPTMLKQRRGAIVNISSISGLVGLPRNAAYSVTKGAVNALTRCIAVEYAKQGIRCNAVCPGLVDTPMAQDLISRPERLAEVMQAYPMGRHGTPDEVARLVLYLASDESAWVTGVLYPIDGGLTAQ